MHRFWFFCLFWWFFISLPKKILWFRVPFLFLCCDYSEEISGQKTNNFGDWTNIGVTPYKYGNDVNNMYLIHVYVTILFYFLLDFGL